MPRSLLLAGGSVVDVRTGSVAVRSVLVRDGRIAAVGDDLSTGDAEHVDASGTWVVPGYNDMHGYRQMSGSPALLRRRRDGGVPDVFAEQDTWHCPTLIRERTNERGDECALHTHPDVRYASAPTLTLWKRTAERYRKLPQATRAFLRDLYAAQLRLPGILDGEGVPLLAGSDVTGASWEVPGTSLHQEFDELAAAGLSPLRILQTTTVDPARFLGLTGDIGTVETGCRADLVLLDGDPTADVANLHRIAGVVRAGTYRSRGDLDATRQRLAADRRAA